MSFHYNSPASLHLHSSSLNVISVIVATFCERPFFVNFDGFCYAIQIHDGRELHRHSSFNLLFALSYPSHMFRCLILVVSVKQGSPQL